MNRFKLWIGVLAVFILGALAGAFGISMYHQYQFAQLMPHAPMPFPPQNMVSRLLERLDAELTLTASQKKQIRIVLEDAGKSVQQFQETYRPEMNAIKEKADARIKTLLTPKQMEKFNDLTARFRRNIGPPPPGSGFQGEMMEGPPPPPDEAPGARFEKMEKKLNLRPEQKKAVRTILEDSDSRRRSLMMNRPFGDPDSQEEIQLKLEEIEKDTEKKLLPILDAEQMQVYTTIRNERKRPIPKW